MPVIAFFLIAFINDLVKPDKRLSLKIYESINCLPSEIFNKYNFTLDDDTVDYLFLNTIEIINTGKEALIDEVILFSLKNRGFKKYKDGPWKENWYNTSETSLDINSNEFSYKIGNLERGKRISTYILSNIPITNDSIKDLSAKVKISSSNKRYLFSSLNLIILFAIVLFVSSILSIRYYFLYSVVKNEFISSGRIIPNEIRWFKSLLDKKKLS